MFRINRTVTLLEGLSQAVLRRAGRGERDKSRVEEDVKEELEGMREERRKRGREGGGGGWGEGG